MLPKLAATVCKTTTGAVSFCCPECSSTRSAKGTKVIRATSVSYTHLGLHLAPLWDFHMVALMHKSHPLAPIADISPSRLAEYPEVLHGDITATSPEDVSPTAQESQSGSHILVYDRAAQFDVLRSVRGSFMWVSPMPAEVLEREQLVPVSYTHLDVYKRQMLYGLVE